MFTDEGTDPRTQRYPIMPESAIHALYVDGRRVVGRVVSIAEVRERGSDDAELARSWRELRTTALSLGQAINSLSAISPQTEHRVPRKGLYWLYWLVTQSP